MIVLLNEDTDVIVVRSPRNNCSEKSSFSGRNKNGGVHSANGLFTLPNVLFLKVYFKVCHLWMITTFLIVGHH